MERLTFISGHGYPAVDNDNCFDDQNEDYCGPAIERLAAYEDSGLTPEQVADLVARAPVWIPVTERLPEGDDQVLAIVSGCWENVTFDHAFELASWSKDGGWIMEAWPELEDPEVPYWMPLPELPKEAGS